VIELAASSAIHSLDPTLYHTSTVRSLQPDAFIFYLQYVVIYSQSNSQSEKTISNLPSSATLLQILDIVLSLPTAEQLETEEFDLDELVSKLTEALEDEPHRTELLSLTGDTAVLVIECLDKVSVS
jgi:hypothetical protein